MMNDGSSEEDIKSGPPCHQKYGEGRLFTIERYINIGCGGLFFLGFCCPLLAFTMAALSGAAILFTGIFGIFILLALSMLLPPLKAISRVTPTEAGFRLKSFISTSDYRWQDFYISENECGLRKLVLSEPQS